MSCCFFLTCEKLELVFPLKSTSSFRVVKLSFKLNSIPPFINLMPLSSFDTHTGALICNLSVTAINCCGHCFTGGLTIAISGLASLGPKAGGITLVLAVGGCLCRVVMQMLSLCYP